jgi:hypothetical protein
VTKRNLVFIALALIVVCLTSGCATTQSNVSTYEQPIVVAEMTRQISEGLVPSSTRTPRPNLVATRQAAELSREQTRIAEITAVALTPTVPHPTYPPLKDITREPRPTGIIGPNLGASYCDCIFENGWLGHLNGREILVYAGTFYWPADAWSKPSNHGVVIIFKKGEDVIWFLTPTDSGSVHVVSVNGAQLTLLSTSGTQFIFDTATENWIEPPITPTVPLVTPIPTVTP